MIAVEVGFVTAESATCSRSVKDLLGAGLLFVLMLYLGYLSSLKRT